MWRCTILVVLQLTLTLSAYGKPSKYEGPVGEKVTIPLVLYDECDREGIVPFVAAGWMGYAGAIERDDCWEKQPHRGKTCIRITCKASKKWYGVVWQAEPHDWGDREAGYDMRKAKKLTFWAKGDKGGERITFTFGILAEGVSYPDSTHGKLKTFRLEPVWKKYTVYATGDKRCIKTGFVWSAKGISEDFTFYLDDIQFE